MKECRLRVLYWQLGTDQHVALCSAVSLSPPSVQSSPEHGSGSELSTRRSRACCDKLGRRTTTGGFSNKPRHRQARRREVREYNHGRAWQAVRQVERRGLLMPFSSPRSKRRVSGERTRRQSQRTWRQCRYCGEQQDSHHDLPRVVRPAPPIPTNRRCKHVVSLRRCYKCSRCASKA